MPRSGTLLIVDGSRAARAFLGWTLRTRFADVESVPDVREALCRISRAPRVTAILADTQIAGGGVRPLLERLRRQHAIPPALLALAARVDHGEEIRILLGGALGCLRKPVAPHDLLRVFDADEPGSARGQHVEPAVAVATLLDAEQAGTRILSWEVRSLSQRGALLRTEAAFPPRTHFQLELALRRELLIVDAEVLPSAGGTGPIRDVAVAFRDLPAHAAATLDLRPPHSACAPA